MRQFLDKLGNGNSCHIYEQVIDSMTSTNRKRNCINSKTLENEIEIVLLKKEIQNRLNYIYYFFRPIRVAYTDQIPDP